MKQKVKCDFCGKMRNRKGTTMYKGKIMCGHCKGNIPSSKMQEKASMAMNPKPRISVEEALNRTYEIKPDVINGGYLRSQGIFFPQCLIGKKIKIILAEEK